MLKISVVTVCYNAAATIEETIQSVLNQTYPNVEYIIIDGGSTDGTVDIIKRYADRVAYWVSEPDKGIYDAMNKGIAAATGDYINFMNAGDRFYEDKVLAKTASAISEHPANENKIFLGDIMCLYCGDILGRVRAENRCSAWYTPPHQGIFLPTNIVKKENYDISYKIIGDRELLCRLYVKCQSSQHTTDVITSYYDLSGVSSNRRNAIKIYREAKAIDDCYFRSSLSTICREYIKAKVKYISHWICSDKLYLKILYSCK